MRFSQMLIPTLRDVPSEAEIASHQLMLRAGLIRKTASGVYSFLPLGYRALKKIEQIVREEMERIGAQELLMPALLPGELLQASGRWEVFGPEMFKLQDRNGRDFCLGPTHEEAFTDIVKDAVKSYKSLPVILYQIQTKYRDERRPRFGLMRSREFIMKDAYSFNRDQTDLDISYRSMYDAYNRIFIRCGLDYMVAEADSGAMGGSGSQEFMVKSEVGESGIAFCESCGYAANEEKAECRPNTLEDAGRESLEQLQTVEKIATPGARTIEDLISFFGCSQKEFAKTLVYKADDRTVAVMIRGDRELNETKLQNYLGCVELKMADEETVKAVTGAEVGFAGPIGIKADLIVDHEVAGMRSFIAGANETDYHLKNVNIHRDAKPFAIADLRRIHDGDACPVCVSPIKIIRGVEVGHIFKLGTKYSEALQCTYLDENGKTRAVEMGCYGIGINRTLAAVIEQHHDDKGIIWPMAAAPYHVIIIIINPANEVQSKTAERLYSELLKAGIEVVLDDRDERAGVKFNDADLIGIPIRITVGKKAGDGIVEVKLRKSEEKEELSVDDAVNMAKMEVFNNLCI